MYIINPDPFLLPAYRISPFTTEYVAKNNQLPKDDFAVGYFDAKFGKGTWKYTYNGREAIELALECYNLKQDDLVTILTSSGNFYISSCVTKSIEKFCRWNREIVPETKVILVNHEFGYPYPEMEKLAATGLPIIEDTCTTFFSQDENRKIGKYGDFAVHSFPKFFPVQIGGMLVSNKNATTSDSVLDENETQFIQNAISFHLKDEATLLQKRKENFDFAKEQFLKLGMTPRFKDNPNINPSALLLNNNRKIEDLNNLKVFLAQNGIQSSIFYGEDAFFIPCHQNMDTSDIEFMYACIEAFTNSPTL
ncbi:DegT/DnrJ/EryC1/StrS family aminotransferase [Flavobacterium sp.]